ncbi:MBOAT family protein [Corallococcus exiguus]|uniref:MBOAT family O-acyltransferase n=1 Tax=Corallococcus TaxID=83461 RepID=UPI000F85BA84|nr:MBOAT family O-acyltransferase [Corallococcus sp. AB018]NNC17761.1 MBOAT family protein [Corallococcus exiguus]RUO92591.1 MBOAT family protein [Corallococcus sp. AB018]
MLSHSLQYVVFVIVVFALYWAVHRHYWPRMLLLLAASLMVYVSFLQVPLTAFVGGMPVGELVVKLVPLFIFLAGVTVDHLLVKGMGSTERPGLRKLLVVLSIVSNLGLLAGFKYLELLRRTVSSLLGPWGVEVRPEPFHFLLPVGLSFFVFQAISYTVDVYRGKASSEHSFVEHLLYMLFFPRVLSGPIVRASELMAHFREVPTLSSDDGNKALFRVAVGLVKKLVIADVLGSGIVDPVFGSPHAYSSAECAVAAVAYTLELYYDFSGYSDIAIGVASLFGFKFPENFARPYLAKNLFEFWNRWHMSLSSWLRDYLYIPLGGNRRSKPRVCFNLMMVMVLGGLWHGADWRFAVWGAVHGVALCGVRCWWWFKGKQQEPGPARVAIGMLATFTLVVLTRVVFRAPDMAHAGEFYARMLAGIPGLANVGPLVWSMLAIAIIAHAVPMKLYDTAALVFLKMPAPARAVVLVLLGLGIRQLSTLETRPYVYLQF